MPMQIGNYPGIGRKLMDSIGNESGSVRIPINRRIILPGHDLPKGNRTVIGVTLGKDINSMKIAAEIEDETADYSKKNIFDDFKGTQSKILKSGLILVDNTNYQRKALDYAQGES